jgi:hypothetical protein
VKTIVAVTAVLALGGCATTNKDYLAMLTAQQAVATQNAEAVRARFNAMAQIAQTGDASSRTAAVMAMAMVQTPQVNLPPPPESEVFKWASVLVPAITNLGANFFTYRLGAINSNNAASTTTAAYNTFGSIATAGFNSNATIAGFIQAPQANVTTTTTTNNTTNNTSNQTTSNATTNTTNTTNSNNTTRTCQGGSGATGGAGGSGTTTGGSGAPGGTGGGANC